MIYVNIHEIFLLTSLFYLFVKAENNCLTIANSTETGVRCCNLPDLKQKTNISNLIMEYPELSNMTQEVVRCSKAKIYMEKSNLTSFDKSDFKNFIKDSTNDSEWIEAFNKAVDQCIDNLSHYKKILQQIHKVRDEDCDIRYQAYITCMHLVARKVNN
ncbi:hypothetical protein ACKWTF_016132 [Chironomus riparius]